MKNRRYSPDGYLNGLYSMYASPFRQASYENAAEIGDGVSNNLKRLLNIDAIPQKTEKLSPQILKVEHRKNYTIETACVEICKGLNMLCYILKPDKPNGSGIAAVCGHGYGCRQIIRQSKRGKYRKINFFDNYQKNFGEQLAEAGYTVAVPEPIGFGEARLDADSFKPFYISSCDTISHHTLLYGLTTASFRIYQTQRCLDLLTELGAEHLGCMGISGGGLVTLYTSCIDKRIEKTVVCGYVNTFKDSVLSRWHCPDNYIPGIITQVGEIYDIASAIAPRDLLITCGTRDKLFPVSASRFAAEKIKNVYAVQNAEEHFIVDIFEGKHEVSFSKVLGFLQKG